MINSIGLVFVGGGLGSVLRFLLALGMQRFWQLHSFPFATLLVNVIGCWLIGFWLLRLPDQSWRFLLMSGFCGGFTTFSALGLESMLLWQNGQHGLLALYIVLSIGLGMAAVWLGMQCALPRG